MKRRWTFHIAQLVANLLSDKPWFIEQGWPKWFKRRKTDAGATAYLLGTWIVDVETVIHIYDLDVVVERCHGPVMEEYPTPWDVLADDLGRHKSDHSECVVELARRVVALDSCASTRMTMIERIHANCFRLSRSRITVRPFSNSTALFEYVNGPGTPMEVIRVNTVGIDTGNMRIGWNDVAAIQTVHPKDRLSSKLVLEVGDGTVALYIAGHEKALVREALHAVWCECSPHALRKH